MKAAGQTEGGKVTVGLDSGAFTPILDAFALEFKAATGIEVEFASYPLGNMNNQNLLALQQDEARIDGAPCYRLFWDILLPLSMPGVLTAGILSMIFAWNEFQFALVLIVSFYMQRALIRSFSVDPAVDKQWSSWLP